MTGVFGASLRVEGIVQSLGIPRPYTTAAFVESVAAMRGRPIVPVRTWSRTGPCGLLLSTPERDYVFYDGTTPMQADHAVAHELGHLVLGHHLTVIGDENATASTGDEVEAELFATLVLTHAMTMARRVTEPIPGLSLAFALPRQRRGAVRYPGRS
jgi:hypothetical protein